MSAKVPHIPQRDERERATGHAYHYSREERYTLSNAPEERKKTGFRRFKILFLDIIILLVGVTLIRRCTMDRIAPSASGKIDTRAVSWITSGPWHARTALDSPPGSATLEYRLSVRRGDGSLFSVDTNAMRVTLAYTEQGTNMTAALRIISPEAKLISHQFFAVFPKARADRFSAVRFRWQTGPDRMLEIPFAGTPADK